MNVIELDSVFLYLLVRIVIWMSVVNYMAIFCVPWFDEVLLKLF
jgi:hypothetical protein